MKKFILTTIKLAISSALIYWVVASAQSKDPETFRRMLSEPKRWDMLAAAFGLCTGALVITFFRWHVLVRALNLPFTRKDAFRLGFLGYFWNFFSVGSVGGDLFKAVFVAREQSGRRAEAVASVVVDRIVGLYAMFLLGAIAILLTGAQNHSDPQIRFICKANFIATGVGSVGVLLLLVPGFTSGRMSRALGRIPKIGVVAERLLNAVRLYRRRWKMVVAAGVMSMAVHAVFTLGIYCAARGIPGAAPTLAEHFVIVPLALVTGVLPLPLSGLGAFEAAMDFLYVRLAAPAAGVVSGQGLLVSLVYRMISIAIALVGAWYYFLARRQFAQTLAEAEKAAEHPIEELESGDGNQASLASCVQ